MLFMRTRSRLFIPAVWLDQVAMGLALRRKMLMFYLKNKNSVYKTSSELRVTTFS